MADEENVEDGQEQPQVEKQPMSGRKRMMIIGLIVVVQVPIVLLVGHTLIRPKLVGADSTTIMEPEIVGRGSIMILDDITVNLSSQKKTRFLRMSIGLEVENDQVIAEIEERKPEIRDVVITSVSGRRVDQLISVEGKERLKTELKERIDAKLQEGSVLKVYFSDFVVQ